MDRLPPHSRDAERGVLGAILRDSLAADVAFDALVEEDFYFDHHRKLWQAIADLRKANVPADLVTTFERLRLLGTSDDVGGHTYLAELWDAIPTAANVEYHAEIVREKAVRRRLLHAATEICRDAQDSGEPAADLIDRFYDSALSSARQRGRDPVTLASALRVVLDGIAARQRGEGRRPIPTGFSELDDTLGGGFRPGELILVGARPSVGKTAIAASFLAAAADQGQASLLFSLEMDSPEVAARVLAMRSSVPLNRIRGDLNDPDGTTAQKLNRAAVDVSVLPIWIDDRADHTPSTLAGVARRAVTRHQVGLIVLDYLQLIAHESRSKNDPQHVRIGDTSRRLKLLARTLGVPVVCLAQLNRECESRPDGRPKLSDFRDCGGLEQDADVAMLLWPQPFPGGIPTDVQEIRVCVEKQRNGPRREVPLDYRRAVTRFEDRMVY
jgi:replicative DNA helicase